jgi:ABC-type molybdate transport system ATPase subunit
MDETGPGEVLVRMTVPHEHATDPSVDDAPAGTSSPPVLLARITRRSKERLALEEHQLVWARVKSVALLD